MSIVHCSARRESVHDIKKYIHRTITILRQATLCFPHNYWPTTCHTWIGWNFLGFTGAARDSLTLSFRLPLPPSISSCTQRPASLSNKLLSLHHALPLTELQHGASPSLASGSPLSKAHIQFHPSGMSSHCSYVNLSRTICFAFRIGTSTKLS